MATANDMDLTVARPMKTQFAELPGQSDGSSLHGNKNFSVVSSSKDRERKIGHRRVDEKTGLVTYKKKTTSELMAAIQLGIGQSVGGLSSKPERDLLMQDFGVVQSIVFPSEGSNMTPAHHCSDFRFKTYAPLAFRYFRELFNIRPDDFMLSLCDEPMNELSNPGAGGSIFYISADDEFIIKTAQHKEANFLQKLLPGYYMNLNQNPRTLLPKFYGLYCYQCGGKNIRFVVMNNILPSVVKMHEKYDLKGSTYKRKASKSERAKSSPTLKDNDFVEFHPDGLLLEKETYDALVKTIQRDCRVLESFKIMDYSLLVGVHNLDVAKIEKSLETAHATISGEGGSVRETLSGELINMQADALIRGKSMRIKVTQYSTPMESIQAEGHDMLEEFDDDDIPPGGIPAKNSKGERLLLYLGIIDILQCYRFRKKFEHTVKSMITDGDTISVTRPSFYSERFQKFFTNTVFKKATSPLKSSPSKRKPVERSGRTTSINEEYRDAILGTMGARPDLLIGSSTPPPPFSEAVKTPRDIRKAFTTASSNIDIQWSDTSFFETVPQHDNLSLHSHSESSLRSSSSVRRHSPVSVSESTPTYTEFTEGTPSYTASSPSFCSEVQDATFPCLPLDSEGISPTPSPTKTMSNSSSTDASYQSAASHLESILDSQWDSTATIIPLCTTEQFDNVQTWTVISNTSAIDIGKMKEDNAKIGVNSLEVDQNSPSDMRISVVKKLSDMSFSSQSVGEVTSTQSLTLSERSDDSLDFSCVNSSDGAGKNHGHDQLDTLVVADTGEIMDVVSSLFH